MGRIIAIIMIVVVVVLALVLQSELIADARLTAASETDRALKLETELATLRADYESLKRQDNQTLADYSHALGELSKLALQNNSLRKQLTAAQKRPTTFTVYQETYPGSPIAKSPLALRFREEGILNTGCGKFIFRARR